MKRLILFLLVSAATIDIAQQAYTIDLVGSIQQKHNAGVNIFTAIVQSPIMATIGHWGLFLIGFGILSLAMSGKKSARSNTLNRPRS